jgi:hypothetical protein
MRTPLRRPKITHLAPPYFHPPALARRLLRQVHLTIAATRGE